MLIFNNNKVSSLLMLILLRSYHYIFHSACMLGSNKVQLQYYECSCCFRYVVNKISELTSTNAFVKTNVTQSTDNVVDNDSGKSILNSERTRYLASNFQEVAIFNQGSYSHNFHQKFSSKDKYECS